VKFVKYLLILAVCCILLGAGSIYGLYKYIEPQLPDVNTLKDVRLQTPMQVYSADGDLIVWRNAPYSFDSAASATCDGESVYCDRR
jgi:membrane carboxypeptidase/penicillin-binding protein